jgi:hypothetical protein
VLPREKPLDSQVSATWRAISRWLSATVIVNRFHGTHSAAARMSADAAPRRSVALLESEMPRRIAQGA